jgi:glycosyltransferase involved in cell wall biosynthesis
LVTRSPDLVNHSLTIIIPAYNEASALAGVLQSLQSAGALDDGHAKIIVVDDGSSDETAAVADQHGATVVRHARNLGYGAALKTGIKRAETPFVATMDADGQHTVEALASLWARRDDADMVVGARSGLHAPLWRMPGKWCLGAMARYLSRQSIPDLNSGLRVYRREVLNRYLHLCPSGFSLTTTITLALLSRGWRVVYVPITVRPRTGRSTVTIVTGLETIILILRIVSLFNPLRVFVPAAALTAGVGILWGVPIALAGRGISVGSMLAIVTAVILFALGLICDQISQLRMERFE